MRRVLRVRSADSLTINVGSASLHIVVDAFRKDIQAVLDACGLEFEGAAGQATLTSTNLVVPPRATNVATYGDVNLSGRSGGGGVVIGSNVQVATFEGGRATSASGAGIASGHLTVTVQIPIGMKIAAAVEAGGITATGPLTDACLRTSGGGILVTHVAGTTMLRSSGGDLTIEKTSGMLIAKTSGGDINASRVAGTAVLMTSGGDIDARADYPLMLSADVSGGNIRISGDYERPNVTAHTSGGRISYQ